MGGPDPRRGVLLTTFTDPAQLAAKLRRAGSAIEAGQKETVKAVAEATKAAIAPKIAGSTGGDGLLSGTKRTTTSRKGITKSTREKKLGVTYRVRDGAQGPYAVVSATGPLQLAEEDVKNHIVVSRFAVAASYDVAITKGKKAGQTRKGRNTRDARIASVAFGLGATGGGRRAVLNFGDGTYRRWTTSHSPGRHPWKKGLAQVQPDVAQIHAAAQRRLVITALSS